MEFEYFISYRHQDKWGNAGFGNCKLSFKKEINSFDEIKAIQELICKYLNFKEVIVLNYIKINCQSK